ncbi:DUF4292 domain-containing protein [Carboxylicivirga sp. N1Y90]|uniref:DUF4292 domain-containing protein n=1 Tax=Carboxylicivirga fragile TaxID=3417571 RepID=UPI003D3249A4|nr:DUF4292 domain-containing protein [Marinilabiliaceae bacterium N1Y90]
MNIRLIFFLFVSLILFGCSSTTKYYNNKGELRNISDARLINSVENEFITCDNLLLKRFKADYIIGDDNKSFKGNLLLTRDSSIIVSITLVKEWFRIKLSPDKVEILDRRKREYIVGDYSLLWDKFMIEIDYNIVQSIILNELYAYPIVADNKDGIKKYKHYLGDEVYLLKSLKNRHVSRMNKPNYSGRPIMHEFTVLPEIFKVSQTYLHDFGSDTKLNIEYSNFIETGKGFYATELSLKGQKSKSEFSINLQFNDVEFDSESNIGFKVSSKYKVVNLLNDN